MQDNRRKRMRNLNLRTKNMATDKVCRNPECLKKFKRKNSKKVYCKLSCKNRGNFLINRKKNERDITWNAGYEQNKKVLISLYNRGVLRVSHEALGYMGFNYNCLKEKHYKGKELAYYIVGGFFLMNDGKDHARLEQLNK